VPASRTVTAAIPPAVVVTGAVGLTVPPPVATVNVTATPETGLPVASVNEHRGGDGHGRARGDRLVVAAAQGDRRGKGRH